MINSCNCRIVWLAVIVATMLTNFYDKMIVLHMMTITVIDSISMTFPAVKQVLILMMAVDNHSNDKFDFQKFVMAQKMMTIADEKMLKIVVMQEYFLLKRWCWQYSIDNYNYGQDNECKFQIFLINFHDNGNSQMLLWLDPWNNS